MCVVFKVGLRWARVALLPPTRVLELIWLLCSPKSTTSCPCRLNEYKTYHIFMLPLLRLYFILGSYISYPQLMSNPLNLYYHPTIFLLIIFFLLVKLDVLCLIKLSYSIPQTKMEVLFLPFFFSSLSRTEI